jgi:type IV pilus assembly protein PilC
MSIEGGSTFSEALAQHPKVFNRLFVNMVKAGELGGVLEVVLNRLAEFMEKAQKIKGKVVAAMFYPVAVMTVAVASWRVLVIVVVPKFKKIFAGTWGRCRPAGLHPTSSSNISEPCGLHMIMTEWAGGLSHAAVMVCLRHCLQGHQDQVWPAGVWDKIKLKMPVLGPVFSKVAISRFTRTLGTLVSSGVPILQALTIVKETSGNVIVANAVSAVHESVKEGETITAPLESRGVSPHGHQHGGRRRANRRLAGNVDEDRR